MAAFEGRFSIKKFLERKVNGEIAFALKLACFMYKYKCQQAGQLPPKHLSFFAKFFIAKYLKQGVDGQSVV